MWQKVEALLSQRVGVWIKRLKEDPLPMGCIVLTVFAIWSQKELHYKDRQIEKLNMTIFVLQQEAHRENREDNLFFRTSYIDLLPFVKPLQNDKTDTANSYNAREFDSIRK